MRLESTLRIVRRLLDVGLVLLFLAGQAAIAGPILDEPIVGGRMLVVEDGNVTAEFLGSDAGYFNTLYLVNSSGDDLYLFDKASSTSGGAIDLGVFKAGTELVFRLDVRNTGLSFYTGDADRNSDGLGHALAISTIDETGTYVTTVGFEDLLGGGDFDYNDFEFRLTNVIDPPAPAPAPPVLALLGVGLVGLGWRYRRAVNAA